MSSDGKLKIWGRKNSINVMKVLWACEELGLPFDRVDVGGDFGGTKDASYLAMNPNSRVPTVEDKGLVLWESNVIVRYLAETYGKGTLQPKEPQRRWIAEQWMDWQQTTLHADATVIFWQLIRTPPDKQDREKIETARRNCASLWAMVDDHLSRTAFMAGPDFSMGDIPLGCAAFRWLNYEGLERPQHLHLEGWYRRLTERAGFQKHVMNPMT